MRRLCLALTLCALPANAADYLLVNGAWVGAWYWDPVVARLEAAGHRAVAVELRGLGTRAAEGGPDVSVADHTADILATLDAANLQDVILVAHSYGGRPATAAWDLARDRIARVVYIEAMAPYAPPPTVIPDDKQSLAFLVMTAPDVADTGMLPPSPTLREMPGHPLAPMPLAALYGAVTLTGGPLPDIPGTYVLGAETRSPGFARLAAHMAETRGWMVETLPGGHDVAGDSAPALADLLIRLAD